MQTPWWFREWLSLIWRPKLQLLKTCIYFKPTDLSSNLVWALYCVNLGRCVISLSASFLMCNQTVHPKGDQSWVFTVRTDAEAETPILWPPQVKNWIIGKDPDAGRDWGWEEKGTTEDEMASPSRWAWVWVNSESWWWTGRPGVLQFMGSQRVGHDWTELNWMWIIMLINIYEVFGT